MKIRETLIVLLAVSFSCIGLTSFTTEPAPDKKSATFNYNYQVNFLGAVQPDLSKSVYYWSWMVSNPNPGDGSDGMTLQDLSHWNLAIANIMTKADVIAVQYSTNGSTWTNLPVEFVIDKSTDECYSNMILKFDAGTSGSAPTYYRLVVNKSFPVGNSMAVFKSGKRTGCDTELVPGLASEPDEDVTIR